MENKVLIYASGGIIQSISSTDPNLKYVIVDLDLIELGYSPISKVMEPDSVFDSGYSSEIFMGLTDNAHLSIINDLKDIKF